MTTPSMPLPPTVELLGRIWPPRDGDQKAILTALSEEQVFADPATALAYFIDVLVWNGEAAVEARPRACYLRLYGAVESVLFFLLHAALQSPSTALRVLCDEPGRIDRLRASFPADRHGNAIDWPAELRRGSRSRRSTVGRGRRCAAAARRRLRTASRIAERRRLRAIGPDRRRCRHSTLRRRQDRI